MISDDKKKKLVAVVFVFFVLLTLGACGTGKEDEDDMDDILIDNTSEGNEGEKAHVILLAGQSNASGISYIQHLKKHVSEEKIKEYTEGYDNIRICYYVDNKNISSEFVPVALGGIHQG